MMGVRDRITIGVHCCWGGGVENRKNCSGEQIGKARALESGRSF